MKTIRVVNLRNEGADIRVCRPSRWGNPWKFRAHGNAGYLIYHGDARESDKLFDLREARNQVIKKYRAWIRKHPELIAELKARVEKVGKDEVTLGCWCKPLQCHADVLKELLEKE